MNHEHNNHEPAGSLEQPTDYAALLRDAQTKPDTESSQERMSEAAVGAIISAVGNHEIKALLLLAMEPGVVYSRADLKRLFDGLQGDTLAWDIDSANLFRFCVDSLGPIGMVVKDEVAITGRPGYVKTDRGGSVGDCIAAEMLEFSLEHPNISLIELMGRTSIAEGSEENRTSIVRLKMFYELATNDLPISQIDLLKKTGIESGATYNILLRRLAELDILTLRERGQVTEDMTTYRPSADRFGRERISSVEYSDTIYSYLENKSSEYSFTLTELVSDLIRDGLIQDSAAKQARHVARNIIDWNVAKGDLQIDEELTNLHASEVDLRPDQAATLEDLLNRTYTIERNDQVTQQHASDFRNRLLNNPDIARKLITKARDSSFMVQKESAEIRREGVYQFLAGAENPLTVGELTSAGVEKSVHQVRRRLYELVKEGRVTERVLRGGRKAYQIVEGDEDEK